MSAPYDRAHRNDRCGGAMSIRNAIASVAVKDLKSSLPWYERLVGRGPDRTEQSGKVEWIFEQGGRLQVHQHESRAGRSAAALAIGNLDVEMLQLNKWGIAVGEVIRTSSERSLLIEDPDGNCITLAEMLLPAALDNPAPATLAPDRHGIHPLERALESIATDARLSLRDVHTFLDSLILDLEALLRASEESMTGSDPGLAAQLLQRAHIVRGKIVNARTSA